MTITELIDELSKLRDKYGNSEIYETGINENEDKFKSILEYCPICFVKAWKYDIEEGLPERFYLLNNYTNKCVDDNN